MFANEGSIMKFIVVLSFVSVDNQDGYQKEELVHCEDKFEAIAIAISRYMDEVYPLKGVAVYENVVRF